MQRSWHPGAPRAPAPQLPPSGQKGKGHRKMSRGRRSHAPRSGAKPRRRHDAQVQSDALPAAAAQIHNDGGRQPAQDLQPDVELRAGSPMRRQRHGVSVSTPRHWWRKSTAGSGPSTKSSPSTATSLCPKTLAPAVTCSRTSWPTSTPAGPPWQAKLQGNPKDERYIKCPCHGQLSLKRVRHLICTH